MIPENSAIKTIAFIENHEVGVYSIRRDLVFALSKDYKVVVLTEMDGSFIDEELQRHIQFINVGKSVLNPISAISYNKKLYTALKKVNPAVCLTFTIRPAIYGNIVARVLNIPTISTITGTGPLFDSKSLSYRIARWLYKRVLKRTIYVFFPNNDDKEGFIDRKYITEKQARRVPGSGVNYDKYHPLPSTRVADGKFIFLYIARLVKDKGILEFIEAATILRNQYPQASFHVIGPLWDGNKKSLTVTKEELDSWIASELIVYHNKQSDVRQYMANADCVVMPSYREGMSNVLLEGASMARPLIATNVTGCKEIVDDGVTGFLCNVQDGPDLAVKMEKMMGLTQEQRNEMGRKGREKMIKEFDKKIVVQKYIQAIEDVVNRK